MELCGVLYELFARYVGTTYDARNRTIVRLRSIKVVSVKVQPHRPLIVRIRGIVELDRVLKVR